MVATSALPWLGLACLGLAEGGEVGEVDEGGDVSRNGNRNGDGVVCISFTLLCDIQDLKD